MTRTPEDFNGIGVREVGINRYHWTGDCREVLDYLVGIEAHACITSPPYWCQRDYGHPDQIGLELRLDDYIEALVDVFRRVRNCLRKGGALWLNLGDTYHGAGYANHGVNGSHWLYSMNGDKRSRRQQGLIKANPQLKPKDLVGVPWRVALALQADGWTLRSEVIWRKTRRMPDPVRDRPAKSHEHMFLLVNGRYSAHWNGAPADVWDIAPAKSTRGHFATWPDELVRRCVEASVPAGGIVLDPFAGRGGALVASMGRRFVGIDVNEAA